MAGIDNYEDYISIEPAGSDEPLPGAIEAAQELDQLIQVSPTDTVTAIMTVHNALVDPAATAESVTNKELSDRQQEIAQAILILFERSRHGRDVRFNEETYDRLAQDPVHSELIGILNRTGRSADRHENPAIYPRRRAIAINGIRMVATTLSAEVSESIADQSEVA